MSKGNFIGPFTGGTNKSSGSFLGGTTPPFADDYSVLLDGVDEYINIDGVQTALAFTTQGTWSFWWKPVDATPLAFEVLMSFGDTNTSTVINAYVRSTTGLLTISSAINGISQFNLTTDLAAFSTGVWSHVCLVQDGISPKIYIDGSLVPQTFSVTTDKTIWFSGMAGLDNGRIGSRNINNGGETLYSNGNVDDIVFTSDAKTLAQVQNIYNGGLPKDEAAISNGVAYFKIDGDIVNTCNDSIGSNNGTYVNVEQADILDYNSIYLDGVDEYLNINSIQTALASTTQGTISLWVKPVDATPIAMGSMFSFGSSNSSSFLLARSNTDGKFSCDIINAGSFEWNLTTDLAVFSDNTWTHIALVQDGVSPVLYVNGVAVAQTFITSTDTTIWFNDLTLNNGRIGSLNRNSIPDTFHYNGNVGNVLFTSDAKSGAEILAIYNGGIRKDESAISNGVSYLSLKDSRDNFNSDVPYQYRFYDSIGSNNADSVNCEKADLDKATPSNSVFNLPNALHEWYGVHASIAGSTMTQPDTGTIGGLTLINPTALQIPTFSSIGSRQSALSDGVDDILQDATVNDFRGSDTSGVMHFVFRTPSSLATNNNILFSVSKSAATTDRFFLFVIGGVVRIIVSSGGINTLIGGATSLSTNTDYIFSVYSDGSLLKGFLGTTLQFNSSGASGIRWFGDIAGTTTGLELLSREIGNANYLVSNQGYVCYTPYVSDAAVLADQLLIANEFGITV